MPNDEMNHIMPFGFNYPDNDSPEHEFILGRKLIADWCAAEKPRLGGTIIHVLDIGCATGKDLLNVKNRLTDKNVDLHGIDYDVDYLAKASASGITTYKLDIEHEKIPVDDKYFDIIIMNQVLEHVKEIFWIFSELSRILKPMGLLIIGVPNLAYLGNRFLLMIGKQPVSIHVLGPHVRGFTAQGLREFIETSSLFKVEKIDGTSFIPFPHRLSKIVSRLLPQSAFSLFFKVRRTKRNGNFIDVLKSSSFQTNYFWGS